MVEHVRLRRPLGLILLRVRCSFLESRPLGLEILFIEVASHDIAGFLFAQQVPSGLGHQQKTTNMLYRLAYEKYSSI